ncbi:MAG: CYTH and CHAD domain-containing protein [Candidatus Limnocylindrales bacterium]
MSTIEVELKYRVGDIAVAERLLAAEAIGPFRALAAARTAQHVDRYLDTADGALAAAGYAARLRQTNGETVVTVKGTTPSDGAMARREEIEGPADRKRAPHDWPPSAARSLILELCGDAPLVELVTVRQLRRKRRLSSDDATAELSLDEVDVVSRGRVVDHFVELEIELTSGDAQRLVEVGNELSATAGLSAAPGSKFETALAARTASELEGPRSPDVEAPPAPGSDGHADIVAAELPPDSPPRPTPLVVGKTPGVVAEDSVAEAGRKVLRFHLARMLAREPGTRAGTDPEELHAMRVATRRMRAAWRVFGDGFRGDRTRRHRRRLRTVAGRLGAVRDLDVLIVASEAYLGAQTITEQLALQPLFAAWRDQRDDARVLLVRELDGDGYARWVDEFRDFVRTEGLGAAAVLPTAPHRIRDTAASRIWASYEAVRAYEPVLRWADVATLHELRIAGKWLRYTLEFVRECLGPDAAGLIARVTALQDHLGLLNDADVAGSMARTFLVERAGRLSEAETAAIGRYLIDREREVARLRRTVGTPWRAVGGVAFRRSLGRAVAAL